MSNRWTPLSPAGTVNVTVAFPISSSVGCTNGRLPPRRLLPAKRTDTVPAAGSVRLNSSDDRLTVTDSPGAYVPSPTTFTPTARCFRSGVAVPNVSNQSTIDSRSILPLSALFVPAARVKKLSPPAARNELAPTEPLPGRVAARSA